MSRHYFGLNLHNEMKFIFVPRRFRFLTKGYSKKKIITIIIYRMNEQLKYMRKW